MRKSALLAALCALAVFGGGVLTGSAAAAGLSPPVADCYAHDQLTRSYSVPELQHALATMPVEIAEYTSCHDVIQRALLAKLGKLKSGSGGSGGSFLPTWLLVVLIVLVLGGLAFGVVAVRNRGQDRD